MSVLTRYGDPMLTAADLHTFAEEAFDETGVAGKRVLCIVPDSTRSMPMPAMFRALCDTLRNRAATVDFLVALGTHPAMPEDDLLGWFGLTRDERQSAYGDTGIFNHEWQNDSALTKLGALPAELIHEWSDGMLSESVDVRINKRILDYDLLCIAGPVFPHEVAGFSGGNKYFFPGIAGPEILHLFHWLAALVTNPRINGTKHTPVRRVIDAAAALIPMDRVCFCLNVVDDQCRGIFYGAPDSAWSLAADAAAETHIVEVDRPYERVLAVCPEKYYDLWVAGKCMYKLESVVADGGELIIYGPHVKEVSATHGATLKRIGYHTRDYFLAQMDRFADVPGGVLAHSTHVKGIGRYADGVERPRIQVTLATGIPKDECEEINLGYRDPATIDPEAWRGREAEGVLVVDNAGEVLYRLKQGNPQPTDVRATTA